MIRRREASTLNFILDLTYLVAALLFPGRF
jgi:hypothetical protein